MVMDMWRYICLGAPRASKYPLFGVSGPKHPTLNGLWDPSPSILGTWSLGADFGKLWSETGACYFGCLKAPLKGIYIYI